MSIFVTVTRHLLYLRTKSRFIYGSSLGDYMEFVILFHLHYVRTKSFFNGERDNHEVETASSDISLVMRKSVFGFSDQATQTGLLSYRD